MKYIDRLMHCFLAATCLSVLLVACAVMPSAVPGKTLGSPLLQRDTMNQLFFFDRAFAADCQNRKIVNTEILEQPKDARFVTGGMVAGSWKERWYLDRCGKVVPYDVQYTPDGKGGTFLRYGEATQIAKTAESEPTGISADLLSAAEAGDANRIQELLTKGADIGARDKHGRTPLMIAAVKGHTAAVTLLLKKGSDVNSRNKYGMTALHFAAGTGRAEVVRTLLAHGANANERESRTNGVPIMSAAASGSIETAKALLERGANVNEKNKLGSTALMGATMNGRSEMVLFLLKSGADGKARNEKGDKALSNLGARCITVEAAQALKDQGSYEQAEIQEALLRVVTGPFTCIELAKFFVESGADVNKQSDYGNTACWHPSNSDPGFSFKTDPPFLASLMLPACG